MGIKNSGYFPQGIAAGLNFCNRVNERKRIKENILSARPTLIMSSRRYGKTSLVLYALQELDLPYVHIDFFSELNETEIQNSILTSIGNFLYSLQPSIPHKAFKLINEFFSDMNISFSITKNALRIGFAKNSNSPAKTILNAFTKLDIFLKKKGKR